MGQSTSQFRYLPQILFLGLQRSGVRRENNVIFLAKQCSFPLTNRCCRPATFPSPRPDETIKKSSNPWNKFQPLGIARAWGSTMERNARAAGRGRAAKSTENRPRTRLSMTNFHRAAKRD